MMRLDAARTLPIGPGRLVAVAGPSGAGKDTLLRFARNLLGGDPNIVFPRRVVTREPSAEEDHDALSEAGFAAAVAAGVNLIQSPEQHTGTMKAGVLSATSTCHTFSDQADGYGRADGVGAVYIKRLSDAIANRDPIRAVIRGSAVNA